MIDKKAINQLIKTFKEESKKIAVGDKKTIAEVKLRLIKAGIITPTGRLTKHYRDKTEKIKERAEKFRVDIERAYKRTAGSRLNFR